MYVIRNLYQDGTLVLVWKKRLPPNNNLLWIRAHLPSSLVHSMTRIRISTASINGGWTWRSNRKTFYLCDLCTQRHANVFHLKKWKKFWWKCPSYMRHRHIVLLCTWREKFKIWQSIDFWNFSRQLGVGSNTLGIQRSPCHILYMPLKIIYASNYNMIENH